MSTENYFLGRQPILNRNEELVAYELLFRSSRARTADVIDASHATANVIINTLTSFGIDDILGKHRGFINLELELLMDDALNLLPGDQVVIELLETLEVTPALVERCRFLKESGFSLALDDHEYSPVYHELYEIVDIIKVDLMLSPATELAEMVKQFRRFPIQLLAEKVETQEEFTLCLNLGFDLFQGYYFAKPSVLEKKRMDDSGAAMLKLMRQFGEDAELDDIEKTFRSDAGLTYKLLMLVNSVGTGIRSKISSVRHAVSILGRQQLKRWTQLALFASSDKRGMENPLVEMAAVRARFMENMAPSHKGLKGNRDSSEKAYMTGILSILGEVYEISMDEVVEKLNLSEDVRMALLSHQGELGELLHVAKLLENMDFDSLGTFLSEAGISHEEMLLSQRRAFSWRNGMA
jgi:c-di-GMP-related signal transduction protein